MRGVQIILRFPRKLTDGEVVRLQDKLNEEMAAFGLEYYVNHWLQSGDTWVQEWKVT